MRGETLINQTLFSFDNADEPKLPDNHNFLFNKLKENEKNNWIKYLYGKSKEGTKTRNLSSHIIGLYDPFADQSTFQSGRRWCVNVYTGCSFSCKYCYTISYIRNTFHPREKKDFNKKLENDLTNIKKLSLHPAPIHISNSTDPLQPLEKIHKHTLLLLNKLKESRSLFTTITILTKNPSILCEPEYLEVIKTLSTNDHLFQIEVTCPFHNDETRKFFEPEAPKVESRLEAIRKLRKENITVALRIDPIFPREPLPKEFFDKPLLKDYDAPMSQTDEDLEILIKFAAEVGCSRVIVSPLKLTTSRFNKAELIPHYLKLYAAANKGKPIKKGTAYRIPWPLYHHWLKEPSALAKSLGIPLFFCKNNLIKTN